MTITDVSARAVAIPLARPTRIATRVLGERHFVIVQVRDEDGAEGIGYAYAGTTGGRLVADAVRDVLAPVIVGTEAGNIAQAWEAMYQESLLVGRRGAVLRALSALDIALWDLRAKRCGVPLAVLLGGTVSQPLPAYASGGYYRPDQGEPAQLVIEEIESNLRAGFRDHKIKVGGLSVAEDAKRVAAAIATIDGTGRLALDANNAYRSVPEAAQAARAFERAAGETGLWWFEEPLTPENIKGHAALAGMLQTPVATGEIHQTRWEFAELVNAGAAAILQPDVGVLGGITEFMRVAQLAACANLPIAPHWHANVHAHLCAALPNAPIIEHFELDKDIYNFEQLVTEETRLQFGDGHVTLADRPGLGIEFDAAVVSKFEIAS